MEYVCKVSPLHLILVQYYGLEIQHPESPSDSIGLTPGFMFLLFHCMPLQTLSWDFDHEGLWWKILGSHLSELSKLVSDLLLNQC